MNILNYSPFLFINAYSFIWLIYFFLTMMALLLITIVVFSFFKRKTEKEKKSWQEKIVTIISEAVFYESDGLAGFDLKQVEGHFLKNKSSRQYFIDEIIHAKKNLSGAPTDNLVYLYESLNLNKDSQQKTKSKKWHIKAKGIHELAVMGQVKYVKEIFRLTNDTHELVRNEAQCALVNFYGFKGLRFLNVIIYPISQWQQIQLLNYVHDLHSANPELLMKWLNSKNKSVVIFAIRLSSLCNCTEVYEDIIRCLNNNDRQIKLNALEYLKKINRDGTGDEIINSYSTSERIIQLNILSVLQETGNEKHINFLMKQLHNDDNAIKLAAAKTLSVIHPSGQVFFQSYLFSDEYPWNVIFKQIENERAA